MKPRHVCSVVCVLGGMLWGAPLALENPSFESGDDGPAGWRSESELSAWRTGDAADGARFVTVTGDGSDNTYWGSDPVGFIPGGLYRLRFQARELDASGGTAVTGPVFCNWDIGVPPAEWRRYSTVFSCPDNLAVDQSWLRFGQWHVGGTVGFDDVGLVSVQPVYLKQADLSLGEGETLEGQRYSFNAPLGGEGRNHSRPLALNRCGFNSNRWVFGADSEVIYRHELAERTQRQVECSVTVGWYAGGQLAVDVRADRGDWVSVGTLGDVGTLEFAVPEALLPAQVVSVRLRARQGQAVGAADSDPGSFQVHGYQYTATVDGPPASIRGTTRYVEVDGPADGLGVTIVSLGDGLPGGNNQAWLRVENDTGRDIRCVPQSRVNATDTSVSEQVTAPAVVLRPGSNEVRIPYRVPGTGEWGLRLELPGAVAWRGTSTLYVPHFYATDYGVRFASPSSSVALWGASSGWKIPRSRPAPTAQGEALLIQAAANEAEAVQLVVRPEIDLRGVQVSATALQGGGGQSIPAQHVELLEVRYVPVSRTTDKTGVIADWPDPLPPLRGGIDVEAGQNQPFWIRVKVPKGTLAGRYSGAIGITADGFQAEVPLAVDVYGFELPDRMTCETAFGFSAANVWRYHKPATEAQRRAILAKYWENYSAHHISPYDPAPLDRFQVRWPRLGGWDGGVRDEEIKAVGDSALRVRDESDTANVAAGYADLVNIPADGVRLRFRYRTGDPGHSFIVTLNHHTAGGQWMSGRNRDMQVTGDGTWQTFDQVITSFPDGAAAFRLSLWATLYADDGHYTGTVWYDDLSLTDAGSGEPLLQGGDFEPVDLDQLVPEFDWSSWDAAMSKAVDTYAFNTVRFPIMGLGGGTFHSRREPSILGFPGGTDEYNRAMEAYLGGVEAHLREKGWLDEAYVYWFDEPAPKDYEFVMNGFRTLKRYAPGLRRMLTEQVEEALIGGPTLWCPVSPHFDLEAAEARREEGESFWWYVCTGPKAPYCTLFIDHPGTELRVWLWQTWERRIKGILVWQTNYWTSSAAYPDPDEPQNPYADPMGWVSGYSTPKGTRRAWGNGDGRFVYPPVAAADAHPDQPVLEGPVDSIRWEMLRDGIEDYEYFVMLRRLLDEKRNRLDDSDHRRMEALLEVPDSVSETMTAFTTDPAPLEAHRRRVAEAISWLRQR